MTAKEPAHFHTSEFHLSCLHLPVKGKSGCPLHVLETDQIQGHSLPWPQVILSRMSLVQRFGKVKFHYIHMYYTYPGVWIYYKAQSAPHSLLNNLTYYIDVPAHVIGSCMHIMAHLPGNNDNSNG